MSDRRRNGSLDYSRESAQTVLAEAAQLIARAPAAVPETSALRTGAVVSINQLTRPRPCRSTGTHAGIRVPPGEPEAVPVAGGSVPRLLVGERQHRLYVLDPEKIEYIESHGNYVKFHIGDTDYISRNSVKRLAGMLCDRGFVRIERSLLLNVRAILYAQRVGRGTYSFTLVSGPCLHSGATYRREILRVLPLAQ
jgi:hypothetical protein